ncbi:MAG: flippase [Patescibacteria group bacterium]
MSTANKIFTNTLWQIIIRFFDIVIGIVNIGLITRILGQTQFGFYTTVFVFLQTLMTISDLGLYMTLLNEISTTEDKKEEKKRVDNIFTIRLLASLLIFILAPFLIKIFPYDQAVKNGVIFLAGAFVWQSLISTLTAIFAKYLDMARATLVYVFSKIVYLLPLIYIYLHAGNLNQILFWNSASAFLGLILFLFFFWRHQPLSFAWDFSYWKKVFKISWPLSLGVILNLVYFRADTLILSAYHSAEKVGLYGAAYKVLEVLTTFPHMFMSLVLPIFTAVWVKRDLDRLQTIQQNTFDFFSIINVWVVLIVWLLSKPMMVLLTGQEFAGSGPILNILVLAVAAIFFGTMFTYLVVALGLQKTMVRYYLAAAIIGLLGYFIFIPRYYYWAAAIVTVLVETLICIWAFRLVQKKLTIRLQTSGFWRILAAGALTFVIFWFFRGAEVIISGILASLVYFVWLYLFKVIDREKIRNILNRQVDA